jgi:hypothetical protein
LIIIFVQREYHSTLSSGTLQTDSSGGLANAFGAKDLIDLIEIKRIE